MKGRKPNTSALNRALDKPPPSPLPVACYLFVWKRKFSHHWPFNNRHLNNWGFWHFDSFDLPLRLVGISNKHICECIREGQADNRSQLRGYCLQLHFDTRILSATVRKVC
jgi:hypothetical protein